MRVKKEFIYETNLETRYMDENGKFDLSKAKLVTYSHGEYYSLGKKLGSFGYSVKKIKGQQNTPARQAARKMQGV